jgi:hypothetical protein
MISQADPFDRLKALSVYMNRWVEEWPKPKYRFNEFVRRKFPHIIPGTVEHARAIATHCFYCNAKLVKVNGKGDHPKRSSIDHYLPQSKGKTERYVICCAECNTKKGCTDPKALVSRMISASLKGNAMWGFHGNKLQRIADQIQKITSDMLYNIGPKIYYFKR